MMPGSGGHSVSGGLPRPDVQAPEPWSFPTPRVSTLSNGIRVLLHDLPGQHVIAVRVVVPIALADEPRHLEGVAALTARLLDEGAGEHSAEEFAELLERYGVAFGAGVIEGGLSADLEVPGRLLPQALGLLSLALRAPAFPPAEVERLVATRLAEFAQESASPPHRAMRAVIATVYAASERASRPTAGTPETVGAIHRDDIAAWFRERVGPTGATVVVAGDLSAYDVEALLEDTLGGWHAPEHQAPSPLRVPERAMQAGRIVLVDRPGSVQAEIAIAAPGPDRKVLPGWAEYPVLAYILGGSPSARIDAVLREEKGYTYGMRSMFRHRPAGGMFLVSGSVRTEVAAESLGILLDLLDTLDSGVSEDELRSGVDYIARTAPGRYATADAVADESAGLALEGLPVEFPTANLRRMEALTTGDIDNAWGRTRASGWTVVIVGDAVTLADPLRALGCGEVDVVAVDDHDGQEPSDPGRPDPLDP